MFQRYAVALAFSLFLAFTLATHSAWAAKGGNGGGGGKPNDDPPPEPPPFKYVLQILPVIDPDWPIDVNAINNAGEVVGRSRRDLGGEHVYEAIIWTDPGQTPTTLNTLLPVSSDWFLGEAVDINDAGQIVGTGYRTDVEGPRAFRYTPADESQPAIIEDLSTLGIRAGTRLGINNLGDVTGEVPDTEGLPRAAVYTGVPGQLDADHLNLIPLPANGRHMRPAAINDLGQVTGTFGSDDIIDYAFRYTPESADSAAQIELFTLHEPKRDFFASYGNDINNSGQVVGVSNAKTGTNTRHAFRDGEGTDVEDLGLLEGGRTSWAYALNDAGDVTGQSTTETGYRGYIYLDGFGMVNLDDLVVGDDADLAVWSANWIVPEDINERAADGWGQITGEIDTSTGPDIPFLLTPQPLP